MRNVRTGMRCAGVLAVFLLGGCASEPAPREEPWHGRDLSGPDWLMQELERGGTFESVFYLQAGQTVTWDWVVPNRAVVTFLVHTHTTDGKEVAYNRTKSDQGRGSLTAATTDQYGLQWTNLDRDAVLWVKLPDGGAARYYPPT